MPQRRTMQEDRDAKCDGGDSRNRQPLCRGHECLVLHVLRGQGENEDEDGADRGVGPEQPFWQTLAANAVQIVGGEDGEGRDRRKDVAGELGSGEGEEEDREERPEDEELGEGVACAGVAEIALGFMADLPLGDGDLDGIDERADGDDGPGHQADEQDAEVVPEGLMVLVAVGGEALQIVLEEEESVEGGVVPLNGDVPRKHHREVKKDAGEPDGATEERPLAAETGEEQDDGEGQEGCDRAFGEGGGGSEEVEVEEPELLAGLVPGVPAEHADAEGRGELHVGGGSAGEADDSDAGGGDERGVEVASGAESPHVEEDQDDEDEGAGGGWEAGGPVVDAELLEEAHGAPVVEGGLLEPGLAVEDWGDRCLRRGSGRSCVDR